jgi:hypothetical protein
MEYRRDGYGARLNYAQNPALDFCCRSISFFHLKIEIARE